MAIDSENKRRSVANWICHIPPVPDGSINAADRIHIAGLYCGIEISEPKVSELLYLTLSNLEGLDLTLSNLEGLVLTLSNIGGG